MPGQDGFVQQTIDHALFPTRTPDQGGEVGLRQAAAPICTPLHVQLCSAAVPACATQRTSAAHPSMPAWGRKRHCQWKCCLAMISQPGWAHMFPTVKLLRHACMHMVGARPNRSACCPLVKPRPDAHLWRRRPRRDQPSTALHMLSNCHVCLMSCCQAPHTCTSLDEPSQASLMLTRSGTTSSSSDRGIRT